MNTKYLLIVAFGCFLNLTAFAQSDSTTLEKVTVKKKLPSPITIVNDRYASRGMF